MNCKAFTNRFAAICQKIVLKREVSGWSKLGIVDGKSYDRNVLQQDFQIPKTTQRYFLDNCINFGTFR